MRGNLASISYLMIIIAGVALLSASEGRKADVVFFGDSLTMGLQASSTDAKFTMILEKRLYAEGYDGASKTVLSALGGLYADLRFSQDVGGTRRRLIVVELGAHAVIDDPSLTPDGYRIGYGLMLDCLQGTGATVVVGTVPWLGWDRSDPLYRRAALFSRIIKEEAGKRSMPVADLWTAMDGRRDIISWDGMHPTDEGHKLIADVYWQQIQPRLNDPRGPFRDACDYNKLLPRATISATGR